MERNDCSKLRWCSVECMEARIQESLSYCRLAHGRFPRLYIFFGLCREYGILTPKLYLVATNSYGLNAHIWFLRMNVPGCMVRETGSERQGCVLRGHR